MADPAKRRATYEDVLNAPEHLVAEILDGELSLHPRPAKPHAAAAAALGEELGPPFKRGKDGPGGCTLSPDWACEVLSPSTTATDRAKKLPIYAREGVRNVWLVDPLQRILEVLRLQSEKWVILSVHEGDARVRAEPFDAIELDLSILWADVDLGG